MKEATVREMIAADTDAVADVHSKAFPRQSSSLEWIECNFKAYPRIQYFVLECENRLVGFIEWIQKSGFRKEVVLELEQIAVLPDYQAKGYGRLLIERSLPFVRHQLESRGASLKNILVTTRTDNSAQKLYASSLGAEVETTIKNLYSADEVVMIARNIDRLGVEKRG
jgi:ribosomal protein S18 acetylase RimI-like enzyme